MEENQALLTNLNGSFMNKTSIGLSNLLECKNSMASYTYKLILLFAMKDCKKEADKKKKTLSSLII